MNVSILKKSVLAAALMAAATGWGNTWYDGSKYTWSYGIGNNTATLMNCNAPNQAAISPAPTGDLTIPTSIENLLVTTIGSYAFYNCSAMTSVTIPESATAIDIWAFAYCSGLTNAVLPSKVSSIPTCVFFRCSELENVVFPTNLCYIGESAFSYTKIRKLNFSNLAITFDRYAFSDSTISALAIPNGSTLQPYAFKSCTLQSVWLPKSVIINEDDVSPFCECSSIHEVSLPSTLSTRTVFSDSITTIQSISLLDGATSIAAQAFSGFTSLTNIVLPSTVTSIGANAFKGCTSLAEITIPKNVMTIDATAFAGCTALKRVTFEGDAPDIVGEGLFFGTPKRLEVRVPRGSVGWGEGVTSEIPDTWSGRVVVFSDEQYDWHEERAINDFKVTFVSTNIVVHYVFNSVQPEFAIPATSDMGFQNIVTEVTSGGVVSIPITWAMNYPTFTAKFGSDFTKALMQPTGKVDAFGNPMRVWQDYVAGTDPTDETDVFSATITMVEDVPVISYTPELDEARKALRKYTVYGKVDLSDKEWTAITEADYPNYHFFKVTVEMK